MGSFKLGKMTLKSLFGTPETTCYPAVQKVAPEGRKGQVVNDIEACILCGICDKACPAHAIQVAKKEGTWSINNFTCVTCGACVRACPKKCLAMDPTFVVPATKIEPFVMTKPEESEEEKAAKKAQAAAAKPASDSAPVVPMTDEEIDAKVAKLPAEKQDKARAALKAKQAKDRAAAGIE